jgi:hypothetical protein
MRVSKELLDMSTESRAIAGIGNAPHDESQAVRLVRPLGPAEGRPLASKVDKAKISARFQAALHATKALFSKAARHDVRSEGVLELDDRDVVPSTVPPPLPSAKALGTKLAQPDVKAFIARRI